MIIRTIEQPTINYRHEPHEPFYINIDNGAIQDISNFPVGILNNMIQDDLFDFIVNNYPNKFEAYVRSYLINKSLEE